MGWIYKEIEDKKTRDMGRWREKAEATRKEERKGRKRQVRMKDRNSPKTTLKKKG